MYNHATETQDPSIGHTAQPLRVHHLWYSGDTHTRFHSTAARVLARWSECVDAQWSSEGPEGSHRPATCPYTVIFTLQAIETWTPVLLQRLRRALGSRAPSLRHRTGTDTDLSMIHVRCVQRPLREQNRTICTPCTPCTPGPVAPSLVLVLLSSSRSCCRRDTYPQLKRRDSASTSSNCLNPSVPDGCLEPETYSVIILSFGRSAPSAHVLSGPQPTGHSLPERGTRMKVMRSRSCVVRAHHSLLCSSNLNSIADGRTERTNG
jgi:hypothetical protein